MNPRSLTPLWWMPRSSRRSTAWANVACARLNARWCTQPGSMGVRAGSGVRSSLVNTVISRPSPGSKYRWLSAALSRFGCSNTNGMPSRPSQKSIDVCRSAPTIVMWCTPWLWSFLMVTPATLPQTPARGGPMPVQPPTRQQLEWIADTFHLTLTEDELDVFEAAAGPALAGFRRLDELPDEHLPVKYPRADLGHRPVGEENPS